MSLLGKILLVVNLLAAGGLVYMASEDWGKRQAVSDGLLRYQLAIQGTPVDPSPGDPSDSSVPVAVPVGPGMQTEYVNKKLFDKHFESARGGELAGGSTPLSQVGEVKELQAKLLQRVDGAGGDAGAIKYLCGSVNPQGGYSPDGILCRLAESFEERAAIRSLAEAKGEAAIPAAKADAMARLARKFDAVLNKPSPSGYEAEGQALKAAEEKLGQAQNDAAALAEFNRLLSLGAPPVSRDDTDRRYRIARLLMLVDPTPDHQKRVMLVVGLQTYLSALGAQTGRVEEATRRAERGYEIDQAAFEDEYEQLKRMALEQDQLVLQQKRVTDGLKSQFVSDDEAVKKRETQKKGLDDTLAEVQKQVAGLLAEQQKVEAALYAVQQQVGKTQRGNFSLEDKLKQAEAAKR